MEFFDQFEHTIDDKGRLVLPAAFRSAFVDGGFLSYLGDSIGLFTDEGFDRHRRKLQLDPAFTRNDLRQIMALTTPFTPDSQHRVSISQKLRDRVSLDREVTVVGQESHVAIFSRDVWRALEQDSEAPDDSGLALADKFNTMGHL